MWGAGGGWGGGGPLGGPRPRPYGNNVPLPTELACERVCPCPVGPLGRDPTHVPLFLLIEYTMLFAPYVWLSARMHCMFLYGFFLRYLVRPKAGQVWATPTIIPEGRDDITRKQF